MSRNGRLWMAVALALLAVGPARAGGAKAPSTAAAVKALIEKQAATLAAGGEGFADTFTADAVAWLPVSTQLAVGPKEITAGVADSWFSSVESPNKVKATDVKVGVIGADSAWVSAALQMSGHYEGADSGGGTNFKWTVHMSGLAKKDGEAWKLVAAHYAHEIKGQWAIDNVVNQSVEPLKPIPGGVYLKDTDQSAAWLESPVDLAANMSKDPAAVLIGSGPKEKAAGAKAAKMLGGWKKVKLAVNGPLREIRGEGWLVLAANLDSPTQTKKDGQVNLQYRVLAILKGDAESGWTVVALHFSNQSSF